MVSQRVRDMTASGALVGTEKFYADNGATNVYVTSSQIKDFTGVAPFVNIVADYGATGDGVTDDQPAFAAFSEDYRNIGATVTLIVPPGAYYFGTSPASIFAGIDDLIVEGHGAFIFDDDSFVTDGYFSFGNGFEPLFVYGDGLAGPIDSVAQGSTTITLKNLSDAAKFIEDSWILIGALELQGESWPFNPFYFEYAYITDINIGTGVITLREPLKRFYLDGYPSYTGFTDYTPVTSGPATIYQIANSNLPGDVQDWGTAEFRGVEFPSPFVNFGARQTKFTDCVFWGAPNVSAQQKYTLERCYIGGEGRTDTRLELDKAVEEFIVKDCTFRYGMLIQSPNNRVYIENSDMGSSGISGTPRFLHVVNSDIKTIEFGCRGFGISEQVIIENCRVGSVGNLDSWRASDITNNIVANLTMTNGVITFASADGPAPWAVPGAVILPWLNAYQRWRHPPFRVIDVSESGGTTSISTTLTDAEWADSSTFGDRIIPHPCTDITVRNSYGCATIESMSRGLPSSPLYTQFSKLFDYPEFDYPYTTAELRGVVREIRIDVIKPYTGIQPELWVGLFDVVDIYGVDPLFVIDARQEGRRVIYGNSGTQLGFKDEVSGTGGDYSDNFGDYVHFNGSAGNVFELTDNIDAEDPETWPVIRITAVMDQGKVAYNRELEAETAHPTFINVMDYGAFGDGSVDDTDAVQSALTDACKRGSAVFFPAGTYKITDTLTITEPIKMFGIGKRNSGALTKGSILYFVHTQTNCIEIGPMSNTTDNGMWVEDLVFYGQNQTVMQHCFVPIYGTGNFALASGGFNRCQFSNFTGNALYFEATGGLAAYYQNMSMTNISCNNIGGFISSDAVTTGLIITMLYLRNINIEVDTNKTIADQYACFDFQYVREINCQNVVYEPANSAFVVFALGGNVGSRFYGLHIETGTDPDYVFMFIDSPSGYTTETVTKIGGIWSVQAVVNKFLYFAPGSDNNHVLIEDFNYYTATTADIYTNDGGTDNLVTVLSGPSGEAICPLIGSLSGGDVEISADGVILLDDFAVFLEGIYIDNEITMTEQGSAPSAPAANGGVLYLEDNGGGKTRLMIKFNTGAAQQIAIQP